MPKKQSDTNIHDLPVKPPIIPSNLSKLEKKACELLLKDPKQHTGDICNKMYNKGLMKDDKYIFKRLHKNELLKQTFAEIKEYWGKVIAYDLAPIAIKNVKKSLKDKTLPPQVKLNYNKMIIDKVMPDSSSPISPNQVNIGQLQAYVVNNVNDGV